MCPAPPSAWPALPAPSLDLCASSALSFCAIQWSMSLQLALLLSRISMFPVCTAYFLDRRAFQVTPKDLAPLMSVESLPPHSTPALWLS